MSDPWDHRVQSIRTRIKFSSVLSRQTFCSINKFPAAHMPKRPKNPFARELASIPQEMFRPIPPVLQPILRLLKAIYQRTVKKDPETATRIPAIETPYLDFTEACAYLRLTERQLRDLCRDHGSLTLGSTTALFGLSGPTWIHGSRPTKCRENRFTIDAGFALRCRILGVKGT
jgi:hypothetical protein